MMGTVLVNNKPTMLASADLIGSGGEGDVFKLGHKLAVKIYHQPTRERGDKLAAIIAAPPQVGNDRISFPQTLVFALDGSIIGFTMPLIGKGFEELLRLAQPKHRVMYRVSTLQVARLFLDGHASVSAIHASGYCIGDFNDFNEKYQGETMLFLDTDAWQFGVFPCPVGSEQYLDPNLYGIDLTTKPVFTPENDWYSYAVLLYKSFLCAHPYGGVHRVVKQLTRRAEQRITVLDRDVTYPQTALSPEILDDYMLERFGRIFADGERTPFPEGTLRRYAESLIECSNCGTWYPNSRRNCPQCSHVAPVTIPITKGVKVTTLYIHNGTTLFSKYYDGQLFVIELNRDNHAILHRGNGTLSMTDLGEYVPGTRYDIFDGKVVSNYANSTTLLYDHTTVETEVFALSRKAVFRCSNRYLFRIAAGTLRYSDGHIERSLRPVMQNQTWFTVKPDGGEHPTVCGFFQIFREQKWWVLFGGLLYDNLPLTPLQTGESLIDVLVRFGSQSVLILRKTQQNSVDYVHRALVDASHTTTNSSREQTDQPLPHGAAYRGGTLLAPTDEGLLQQKGGNDRVFEQTKGLIDSGDTLYPYGNALLVVKSDRVLQIELT